MEGTGFQPPTLTVNVGDKVVWVNKDPFPHTATAGGVFDSKRIAAGAKWTYTTRTRGDFAYVCTLHPTMKARLIVK
jgi:plastocyanin